MTREVRWVVFIMVPAGLFSLPFPPHLPTLSTLLTLPSTSFPDPSPSRPLTHFVRSL